MPIESLFCNFCLLTLLLLIEPVQSRMTVCVLILCTNYEGEHSVFDIHLFSIFWIKYLFEILELKVVFRNFFAECTLQDEFKDRWRFFHDNHIHDILKYFDTR